MNVNERNSTNALKTTFSNLKDLTPSLDKHCTYDAFNSDFVVEYKKRKSKYDGTTLIEKKKLDSNCSLGKWFVYAVTVDTDLYLFNITKMMKDGYEFNWETRRQPATTSFENTNWIDKEVGYINFDDAAYVLDIKRMKLKIKL